MNTQEKIKQISIPHTSSIRGAMEAIDRGALGIALLVEPENNRFVGLVTDGDIRRSLLNGLGLETSVKEVQRPATITARIGMTAEQIAELFSDPIRVVPVLDKYDRVNNLAILDRRMHLPVAEPSLGTRELEYVTECVLSGWVSSAGKFVNKFEERFAEFCETKYAIATSSGTTALHLALLALGIGPGDEVIVPTFTFVATANAVTYTGARPVFVDVEKETWNIDPRQVEKSITPKTKAIIPVHIYGHPANMEPLLKLAEMNGLVIVEDAAEAHGAKYKNRFVGSLGNVGTFSFYGNKIITTGEGGMIVTDNQNLVEKIRLLRDHGMSPAKRYWHTVVGYNYRLTNVQAAIGLAQLEKINEILAARNKIAQLYTAGLRDVPGIILPPQMAWAAPVCWLYSIAIDEQKYGASRSALMNQLSQHGIDTRALFPSLHTQPIYPTGQSLPVSEWLSQNGLSLPSYVGLTEEDLQRVVNIICSFPSSLHC